MTISFFSMCQIPYRIYDYFFLFSVPNSIENIQLFLSFQCVKFHREYDYFFLFNVSNSIENI